MKTPLVNNLPLKDVSESAGAVDPVRTELPPSESHPRAEPLEAMEDEEFKAYFNELLRRVRARTAGARLPLTSRWNTSSQTSGIGSSAGAAQSARRQVPGSLMDCSKMRELASEAAQAAIYACEKQRFEQEAKSCVMVTILVAILAVAFLRWGPLVHDTFRYAAWLPCLLALACLGRALWLSFRLGRFVPATNKKRRKG